MEPKYTKLKISQADFTRKVNENAKVMRDSLKEQGGTLSFDACKDEIRRELKMKFIIKD